jgi:hypothetical protein
MPEPGKGRAAQLREKAVDARERKILDDIKTHPCSVLQVREEGGIPGWSYTVGLFETPRQPEVIVIGLKEELALSLLNHIARLLREGKRFDEGHRETGLLSTVECEFRQVEKRWLRQVMGYATWFYGEDSFSVLQCVYPDLDNRFPWDEGFTARWRARQPLLFPNCPPSVVEVDFWATNDPKSSLHRWTLPLPPHTGVYSTKRIMARAVPRKLFCGHMAQMSFPHCAWQGLECVGFNRFFTRLAQSRLGHRTLVRRAEGVIDDRL